MKKIELVIWLIANVLLCIASSNSCVFNYVPDANIDDPVDFPWQMKTTWNRKIINCECGTASNSSGSSTNDNAWVALIRVRWLGDIENSYKDSFCSGSLINSKFVLTAYSCFTKGDLNAFETWSPKKNQQVKPENITVWFPVTKEFDPTNSTDGLNVTEIIYDKTYVVSYVMKDKTIRNNVALLKLEKEIKFEDEDASVPVCLNPIVKITSGLDGRVYGWYSIKGKKQKGSVNSGLLIMSLKDCRADSQMSISDGHICVPHLTEGRQFDGYGSPLGILSLSKQYLLQTGIYSWDALSAHRLVYTTVESVIQFINYYSEIHGASWCKEQSEGAFISKKSEGSNAAVASEWRWLNSTNNVRKETNSCTCGMHGGAQGRIVGGVDASPHEFKWQVLLRIRIFTDENKQKVSTTLCSGSFINDRMILLAAHCMVQKALMNLDEHPEVSANDVEVYAYIHTRNDDPEAQKLKVKRVLSHPGYITAQKSKPPYFDWDVALLELEQPVKFEQDKIIPICLPKSGEKLNLIGKSAVVTGWGLTDTVNADSLASTLQKLDVPIQDLSYCKKIATDKITDNFICAGTLNRNKDAAEGDSGGPLSIIGSNPNQYVQVGIVSWGEDIKGSTDKTAALYTDVQSVLSYIDYYSNEVGAEWCSTSINETPKPA